MDFGKFIIVDLWTFSFFFQVGPFVDSEHPEIKKGTVDRSFDEIFQHEILRRVST